MSDYMQGWAERLLDEYKKGRKQLRDSLKKIDKKTTEGKADQKTINSAIRDMNFVIEWLETGMFPKENPLWRSDKYKALRHSGDFVYGVNGYWDDSVGAFISMNAYNDPYKKIEKKIDEELEEKRLDGAIKHDSEH